MSSVAKERILRLPDPDKDGRYIKAFIREPEKGINPSTALLVILHGLGGRQSDISYKRMRKTFADQHNLITIGINTLGTDVYCADTPYINQQLTRLTQELFAAEKQGLNTGMRPYGPGNFTPDPHRWHYAENAQATQELEKPLADDYWDWGCEQALDVLKVLSHLKEELITLPPVHLVGESAGSQVGAMCLKFAPQTFASFLDISGIFLKGDELLEKLLSDPFARLHSLHVRASAIPLQNGNRLLLFSRSPVGFHPQKGRHGIPLKSAAQLRDVFNPSHYCGGGNHGIIHSLHGSLDPLICEQDKQKMHAVWAAQGWRCRLETLSEADVDQNLFANASHQCLKDRLQAYEKFGAPIWQTQITTESEIGTKTEYQFATEDGLYHLSFDPNPTLRFCS